MCQSAQTVTGVIVMTPSNPGGDAHFHPRALARLPVVTDRAPCLGCLLCLCWTCLFLQPDIREILAVDAKAAAVA